MPPARANRRRFGASDRFARRANLNRRSSVRYRTDRTRTHRCVGGAARGPIRASARFERGTGSCRSGWRAPRQSYSVRALIRHTRTRPAPAGAGSAQAAQRDLRVRRSRRHGLLRQSRHGLADEAHAGRRRRRSRRRRPGRRGLLQLGARTARSRGGVRRAYPRHGFPHECGHLPARGGWRRRVSGPDPALCGLLAGPNGADRGL